MFSKNNTYFHFSHPASSSTPTATPNMNGLEIFLHHPEFFSGHYHHHHHHHSATPSGLLGQPDSTLLSALDHHHPPSPAGPQPRKQTSKKDRHSKIYTSQGPRDRRVRLSIDIARKFFDLQEMLGFEKPSKTLDWLLTKSKAAIRDLVHSKDKQGPDTGPSEADASCVDGGSRGKLGNGKNKEALDLAKESRAKARARARERTREKMCIKWMDGPCLNAGQGGVFQLSESRESMLGGSVGQNPNHPIVQECVQSKRKPKNPLFFGFDHNYRSPVSFPIENWDVCGSASQTNLQCAVFDQHKFMNRALQTCEELMECSRILDQ